MSMTIRKENGPVPSPTNAPTEWDPFRAMREMLRWDPFRDLPAFAGHEQRSFWPTFEVKETKDAYLFKADVPGMKESDLEVTLNRNRLTVQGKREQEHEDKGDTYYACERSYGSFSRSFTLPEGIDGDHLKAELKEGVLTIALPKAPEARPKKIAIGSGQAPKT
jgi:HSP20 family protein